VPRVAFNQLWISDFIYASSWRGWVVLPRILVPDMAAYDTVYEGLSMPLWGSRG